MIVEMIVRLAKSNDYMIDTIPSRNNHPAMDAFKEPVIAIAKK
jgi:hypothetical protein